MTCHSFPNILSTPVVLKVGSTFSKNTAYTRVQNAAEVWHQHEYDSHHHILCSQPKDEHDEEQQVGKWNSHVKHLHIHEEEENRIISIDR